AYKMFILGLPWAYAKKVVKESHLHNRFPKRSNFKKAWKIAMNRWKEDSETLRFISGTNNNIDFNELVVTKEYQPSQIRASERKTVNETKKGFRPPTIISSQKKV